MFDMKPAGSVAVVDCQGNRFTVLLFCQNKRKIYLQLLKSGGTGNQEQDIENQEQKERLHHTSSGTSAKSESEPAKSESSYSMHALRGRTKEVNEGTLPHI